MNNLYAGCCELQLLDGRINCEDIRQCTDEKVKNLAKGNLDFPFNIQLCIVQSNRSKVVGNLQFSAQLWIY